jgi:outer membrane receptor protein involved in Fe transport
VQELLIDEANCRLGSDINGNPVDPNSPTCLDALARVNRLANGNLYGVYVSPINVARERTNGVDLSTHYRLDTGIGTFRFSGNYTWTHEHDFQQYDGDVTIDQYAVNSGFDIPRSKASASVSWEKDALTLTLHGERLGRLPNSDSYDQIVDIDAGEKAWIGATYRYNASAQYRFSDHAQLSLAVTNLFDKLPPKDPTYTAYPYYDISWFDSLGRSYYVQFTYKFGGSAL